MKTFLKGVGILVLAVLLVGAGVIGWASVVSARSMSRTIEAHDVDFSVPLPLASEEIEALGLSGEALSEEALGAVALEQAVERGRHLTQARFACTECHGADFGGGVMVDAFPLGSFFGPNLTLGEGSATREYTARDWDRIVRHGLLPDGRPAIMPTEEFAGMSDQELSDIVAFIRSLPPVDREMPERAFGPLGKVLLATGQIRFSADRVETHMAAHPAVPPPAEVSLAFGAHLATTCAGCHGPEFAGGKIVGGDPSWGPAANLTSHADGLAEWSLDDFRTALTEGRRPDGTEVIEPMTFVTPYAQRMTEVELEALWVYLQSLPARPTP